MLDSVLRAKTRRAVVIAGATVACSVGAACGSDEDGNSLMRRGLGDAGITCPPGPTVDAGVDAGTSSACEPVVRAHPIEGNTHLPVCAPLTFGTNPPSSGNHYAIWAAYQTYTKPFPRGFWVHSLEHGAVVITYNCPDGCDDEVARAQAFVDALPGDCGEGARRIILMPDPELDVPFAASAWGFTLKAKCFDRDAFGCFIADHYDRAPETICTNGADPTGGASGPPICP